MLLLVKNKIFLMVFFFVSGCIRQNHELRTPTRCHKFISLVNKWQGERKFRFGGDHVTQILVISLLHMIGWNV